MALPGSGPLSMSMIRTETSQSSMINYAMGGWTWGEASIFSCGGLSYTGYAPINILSSGSIFNESSRLPLLNLSMSAWYQYNHSAEIPTAITGSLYQHANVLYKNYPSSMIVIELGTTNTTYSINISGSSENNENVFIIYGRPWKVDGGYDLINSDKIVYNGFGLGTVNTSFNYNYVYNAASGSKLYCILANGYFIPS
jgi:hypothetical protein